MIKVNLSVYPSGTRIVSLVNTSTKTMAKVMFGYACNTRDGLPFLWVRFGEPGVVRSLGRFNEAMDEVSYVGGGA